MEAPELRLRKAGAFADAGDVGHLGNAPSLAASPRGTADLRRHHGGGGDRRGIDGDPLGPPGAQHRDELRQRADEADDRAEYPEERCCGHGDILGAAPS